MDMSAAHRKASSSTPNPGGFFFSGMQVRASTNPPKRTLFLPGSPTSTIRNHLIAMCGEFAGTFLFLFFAFTGTQVANSQTQGTTGTTIAQGSNPAQLLYISLCFGFSLAVNAWAFFRISGGLFNPAVTFGMCLVGAVPWVRGGLIVFSQLIGGISAAGIVSALYPGPLNVRTTLGAGTSKAQGVFIEMFLTAELVFTIFMLAAEKHKGTFIAPIGIGLALFIAELGGVYYTGGSLNPARSFGPCVIVAIFEDYHWIYWLGPFLGSLLAAFFYKILKALEYETANPGQDFDENETKLFNPETDVDRPMVNLVSAGSTSEPVGPSRPISGDTLEGFRNNSTPVKGRRGSSPLQPLGAKSEKATSAGALAAAGNGDEISPAGPHPTVTGERLDPRSREVKAGDVYQAGPDAEAGMHLPHQ